MGVAAVPDVVPDAFGPVLAGVATVGAVGGFGYFIDGPRVVAVGSYTPKRQANAK